MIESPEKVNGNEIVIVDVNDHWVAPCRPFFFCIIGWSLALLFFWFASTIQSDMAKTALTLQLLGFFLIIANIHMLFAYLYNWEVSSLIITTKRLITFEFLPIERHDTDCNEIRNIREVKSTQHGILQTILNYGSVFINHAGSKEVTIKYVPHPDKFVHILETIINTPNDKLDIEELRRVYKRNPIVEAQS